MLRQDNANHPLDESCN